jgi:endonuclease YncB( thermonuclease family)
LKKRLASCIQTSEGSIVPYALVAIPLLLWSVTTLADFFGTVVAIHDGDTLTVLVDRKQVKVRIADIDAPEAKQAFVTRSRQALATLCHQKPAQVIDKGLDRYGRTIGVVSCAGWDAATEQVRAGMAWVFTRYASQIRHCTRSRQKPERHVAGSGLIRMRSRLGNGGRKNELLKLARLRDEEMRD